MYGGSSKLGRGGGGGGRGGGGPRNRSSFPPPPPHRPSSATQTGRLSLGSAPRNRPGIGGGLGPAPAVEESFSLVSGNNPLAFGMIIRLAPDLVEEIRRLEAQGGTAKIKFDSIPTNPGGNVIDVGGKEFRFTWSREVSDHDIYEERQSGGDGNGLLVESGCAWRKLNVQRVLDESTTNHVKMRSEEAERKHKSRKAIVLDHGNPSMKNQIKQLAAAEASPWKSHFKKKEPPPRKQTSQAVVGGPPKSGYKPGLISATNVKGRPSTSPLRSPPERSGPAASPAGIGNITKSHTSIEDAMHPSVKSKESGSEKEIPTRVTTAVREMAGHRGNLGDKPMDLQSLLITLLKENPKGMSLKARARTDKEGSDVDVDIMTSDDDKETKQDMHTSEPGLVSSPIQWQTEHGRALQNGMDENQDGDGSDAVDIEGNGSDAVDIEGHGSDAIDIEKDLLEDEQEVGTSFNSRKDGEKPEEGTKPYSSDHDEIQERQNFIGNLFDDTENIIKDSVGHEQYDTSERLSKAKSKRGTDLKHFDERSERTKRLKSDSLSQPPSSGSRDPSFSGSIRNFSPSRPIDDPYQSSSGQMMSKGDREEHSDFGSQKGHNHVFPRKSTSDFHQSGRRTSDQGARAKVTDTSERPMKNTESSGYGRKFSEKNVHDSYLIQKDNPSRNAQNEDGLMKDKKLLRNPKEGAGGKNAVPSDFQHRKHGETVGKFKDAGQISPKDNNRITGDRYPVNGKSNVLQRELSHLELGEIREPTVEETPTKKQFERKNSFKQSGTRPSISENLNPDQSRGKPVGKTNWDSGKPSPNQSGLKRSPEHYVEDFTRPHHRVVQSQQQHLSRVDRPEVGSQLNKLADTSSKTRQNETAGKLEVGLEGYGESHKKAPASAPQQQESRRGSVSQSIKESKILTSNKTADVTDVRKDTVLSVGNVNGQKKRASSSDDDFFPYSKYEKDEPENKGPIKDSSQYEEYMNEFREKYESYNDLDKTLQTYRTDFEKMGKELEYLKERDRERYFKTMDQMLESYRQCGMRHKRLKKIFVVLHFELKNLKQRLLEYARSVG
ncbi:hypothetical protein COLO4_30609 [Corchorus olitorius]|uniref:OCEL domain-containing protein n=1 Tax=Corchorus olitorius TaxID=93759 RepID=A0A1R3H7L5_9ROSI|nr:hypothetical protein COLO4_30609 [Corchorus olitorius]